MIKLISVRKNGDRSLDLAFSDGTHGTWSAEDVIARGTELTRPLAESSYFARAFIESGALAWPNGLEFSATSLQRRMADAGLLNQKAA